MYVLDLLVSEAVHSINRDLRTGTRSQASWIAEQYGIGYNREIIDDAAEAFAAIDLSLPTVRAFHGGRTTPAAVPTVGSLYSDPGLVFASLVPTTALLYSLHRELDYQPSAAPVLWELEVRNGLFLPDPPQRSKSLMRQCYFHGRLSRCDQQIIIPMGSTWSISSVDVDDAGVTRVVATQV